MLNDRKEIIVIGAGTLAIGISTALPLSVVAHDGNCTLLMLAACCLAFFGAHTSRNRRSRPIHRYPGPRDRQIQRNHYFRDISHRPPHDPVYEPLGCKHLQFDLEHVVLFTSAIQGAHHVSHANGDARIKALDKETFETMWQDSEPDGRGTVAGLFFRHTHTEFRGDGIDPSPWLDYMPSVSPPFLCTSHHSTNDMTQFCTVSEHDLIPGSTAGYTFNTVTLNTPAYLNWLLARFLSGGGTTKRSNLQHISQVLDTTTNPAAVIACPGIGARFLGGIEDKDIYPLRGQTVVLHAPWIKNGRTLSGADGSFVFMMPRCTGDVVVGGKKVPDDWQVSPSKSIQHRALRNGPPSSPMCSRSVQKLHLPLSVQAVNRQLKTWRRSLSTKAVGYVRQGKEESDSRSVLLNEVKEKTFQSSITMGEFTAQFLLESVVLTCVVTTTPRAVILEWDSSLRGDLQGLRWSCLRVPSIRQRRAQQINVP
ncbi:hypothetical protein JVT61DRAFT_10270 [Boletus reticuloceps]|uniref:FAD dependent oxidoreductase domain-containing protein n=1 Tax=Boletus reticuloceps TaxID=495285 RepID=A0A8I2YWH4_9AGAM|nr:hypothetical protein JVT61DRAFT_10270 [Boletus reticuloceps]